MSATAEKIRSYWNTRLAGHDPSRRQFWYHHPQALAHYRAQVSRIAAPVAWKPLHCWMAEHLPGHVFERGLSIGCGAGHKELALLADGRVGRFDLWELSDAVIAEGERNAARQGISARARFRRGDAFAGPVPVGSHDLVHWDNALHHMFDTPAAIAFSVQALRPGGWLLIDDYVGPSYMQVSPRVRAAADRVRGALPERYLRNTGPGAERWPILRKSPDIPVARFLETDPSEMADSGNILPATARLLPGAQVIRTGGILFFLGLRPLFGNFDPEDAADTALLAELLEWDALWTRHNPEDTFHAVIAWQKPG